MDFRGALPHPAKRQAGEARQDDCESPEPVGGKCGHGRGRSLAQSKISGSREAVQAEVRCDEAIPADGVDGTRDRIVRHTRHEHARGAEEGEAREPRQVAGPAVVALLMTRETVPTCTTEDPEPPAQPSVVKLEREIRRAGAERPGRVARSRGRRLRRRRADRARFRTAPGIAALHRLRAGPLRVQA